MSKDPLPTKSSNLYHIQLDNWKLNASAIEPDLPPEEVTWRDAFNIVHTKQAKYQAANALTWGMVIPTDTNVPPFLGVIRATHGDFFPMFEVPFLYGQGWQNYDENDVHYITVLSKETNQRVFSGVNSVGFTLPMLGKLFTVVGVLNDWHPAPKFFDLSMGAFAKPEDVYIPLSLKADLALPHGGNSHCWEKDIGDQYKSFLNSECVNFNLWVELESESDYNNYANFLSNYVQQQRQLGRFTKPTNNIMLSLPQWLAYKQVVGQDIFVFFSLALLFLLVCLFNAGSLISSKLHSTQRELALRRALGASQSDIFKQCLTEVMILGVIGSLVGLLISFIGMWGIRWLYPDFNEFVFLDLGLVVICIVASLITSLIAGLGPSIKICRTAPAAFLKFG